MGRNKRESDAGTLSRVCFLKLASSSTLSRYQCCNNLDQEKSECAHPALWTEEQGVAAAQSVTRPWFPCFVPTWPDCGLCVTWSRCHS